MSPSATSINVCFDYQCVSTKRIPLLASPRGGVAEQSRKYRAASAFARTGWCSDRWDKEPHPGSVNKEASRRFLGDAATPPRGNARRGIRSFQNDTSHAHIAVSSALGSTPPAPDNFAVCSWPLSLPACRRTQPFPPLIHWLRLQRRKAPFRDRFLHPIRDRMPG